MSEQVRLLHCPTINYTVSAPTPSRSYPVYAFLPPSPSSPGFPSVRPRAPPLALVHLALLLVHVACGCGAVVGAVGLGGANALVVAMLRETLAGAVLLCAALLRDRRPPLRCDWWRLAACGCCLYANNLCYLVGLKLSRNADVAALWQVTQPVVTCVAAVALGWERVTAFNVAGTALAVGGIAFAVVFGASTRVFTRSIAPNACFLANCLAASLYVIVSKPLLKGRGYRATTVVGWSSLFSSVLMLATNAAVDFWPAALGALCPDCDGHAFAVPLLALAVLAYFAVLCSVAGCAVVTWANKWVEASTVSAYLVVQLLATVALCLALGAAGVGGMPELGLHDLGAVPVALGLVLVVAGQHVDVRRRKAEEAAAQAAVGTQATASQSLI
eukprot:m51a1_g10112 hypothetical protein (387) ;mRNA; r:20619-21866